ncbi:MAG: Gfo/Idh/MocA family oxidoreductase [Hyphomonas sp.]|uniref:Gfo/Idh/MocA family protein n=1 Tax=Hyphomonas sp. TaxID=87 RepID=UPI0017CD74D5|nr:Gfo/Idh/MocA family oxidoreductase [Hyphomonas sp.]MBA3067808.1 Gfo/Idh/MocA family oxidoreductase [Hyphomonas sp.]MBU3919524.1 Gfo/Idh/MocA family oxidoreductase [Alphaproteobacteria bacterium]MBU4063906.1 Gfo/Idh/MocA family oxidoreductase [Alphaproteobacteria bacterium]MBU4163296.1 Gfo/Idh/MocA family oxidoreductase [Alphaproteobacteria bacterium]
MTTPSAALKVAQIGAGYWGKNLARNFAELGALAAVVDDHPETAAREAEKNRVPVRTLGEVLADPTIAAVSIAAPAEAHAALALKAFAAGKHVFVEKPLALTLDDSRAMCDSADKAGRLLMVGHLLQYHPAFVTLLDLVRRGEIGGLRYAYSHRLSLGKLRTEENALWSFAPHDLSMLLALFDERPATVTGGGSAWVTRGLEDEYRLDMTFAGGRRAHVFAAWLHPFKEHRLVVVGETGMAVFEDSAAKPEDKLRLYRHRVDYKPGGPEAIKAEAEPVAFPPDEPLKAECRHFLECCASGKSPRTDGAEALRVVETLLRAEAHTSLPANID